MSTQHTGAPTAIGGGDRPLETGDVVGEYVIQAPLGKGGFGTVYRAAHPVIGKQVAIKVLARRYSSDEEMVSRFVAEARAVNQIRHRNIIDIFSFGQLVDGRHYYVMEFLDGAPLDRHLQAHGSLPLEQALPILRAIARALDAAHAKGIAHRDLKPENILVSFDEEGNTFPKLLDFGIAKLSSPEEDQAHRTGTGVPLGTPYYMSPEQCRGRDVDHRTDIYSLGVVAFRLLTGDYPFHGEMIEILHKHMRESPPPASSVLPGLPPAVDHAIAWMMKKDPAERPKSAAVAIAALTGDTTGPALTPSTLTPPTVRLGARAHAAAGTEDTLASAPTVTPSIPAAARSRAPWLAIGIALVACAGGFLAWTQLRGEDEPVKPAPAPAVAPAPPLAPPIAGPIVVDIPAKPRRVIITLDGAPTGTRVTSAGTEIGIAPDIELEYGTEERILYLTADYHVPVSIKVTPDKAQRVPVKMRKKARVGGTTGPKPPATGSGKDDIIHSIPELDGK